MGSKILKWELQPWGKMAQWWFHSTMECPQCKAPVKDKECIILCPDNLAQETWTQSLASLQKWTREQQTDHTIISTLILGLQHWHDNRDIPDSELVSLLIQAQAQISWEFVLDGWLTKQWQYHQEQTWQVVQSFHSSRQWMTELIKKLWNVAWDMWVHHNYILHSLPQAKEAILKSKANQQIQEIYAVGPQALPWSFLYLLWDPMEEILQLLVTTKQQWVKSIAIA